MWARIAEPRVVDDSKVLGMEKRKRGALRGLELKARQCRDTADRIDVLLKGKRGFAQQQQIVGIGKALKLLPIKTITAGGDTSPQNLFK
ncbi:hypothetical protein NPIL_523691 [Nephila pilipes]|uniref:Uncharacterized protein n=1 Tax=Nephila pilipes TaxID=299642 RepID=A0A8X6TXF1_NEPPI|nr:hypothetical protein NPIL_523691 [Nephila pilipes]